jgi:hypothetical protein
MPAPHASRTLTTTSSECWSGAGGIACAEETKVAAKAIAIKRIIGFLPVKIERFADTARRQRRAEIRYEQSGLAPK